ncbi:hypothetical protein ZOSMA_288G00160 [Zostera marina]|uniref:Uncharacterized protein n=1 Tax=Zostera marina TaxID=29655 RepID=A0A0K9PCN1_ZOSMR|nr:hypothetical protein ZOSMA_288G00160 [Zostera marina]
MFREEKEKEGEGGIIQKNQTRRNTARVVVGPGFLYASNHMTLMMMISVVERKKFTLSEIISKSKGELINIRSEPDDK